MSKHRVVKHHWVNGTLETLEGWCRTLEQAMRHSELASTLAGVEIIKVYNEAGELVHQTNKQATDVNSYA
jgi:hypothetical protein